MNKKTVEPQYQPCVDLYGSQGLQSLGIMSSHTWWTDPKRLLFVLSRYKFVSKMLSGFESVLEAGCGDGFASRIVAQTVGNLVATDMDSYFIERANSQRRPDDPYPIKYRVHDMLRGPFVLKKAGIPSEEMWPGGDFDGVFCLDVLEHISNENELKFLGNLRDSLGDDRGVLIIGMPSLESQVHASAQSKQGHINCMDADQLHELMSHFFCNVLTFSMNDEVVHTGFEPMAHYMFAVCTSKNT